MDETNIARNRSGFDPAIGIIVSLIAFTVGGVLAVALAPSEREGLRVLLGLVSGILLTSLLARFLGRRDWFHPLSLPAVYVGIVLTVPVMFVLWTGQSLDLLRESDLSPEALTVLGLTLAGLLLGLNLGLLRRFPTRSRGATERRFMVLSGRALLVTATAARMAELLLTSPSQAYGEGQLAFDAESSVRTFVNGAVLVSIILTSIGQSDSLKSRLLAPVDWTLFLLFSAATLATGARAPLLAPCLFLAWVYNGRIKRITWRVGLPLLIVAILVFQFVGVVRLSNSERFLRETSATQRTLQGLSSPVLITANVVQRVPEQREFLLGSTYWAAVKRQLPGPLSRHLFGFPDDTGTFVYRRLIGFESEDHGFGFAFPAEAYINFGFPGALMISFFFGLIFSWSYRFADVRAVRGQGVLYPLMLATLPYGFRADALTHLKLVLLPLVGVSVFFWISRNRINRGAFRGRALPSQCFLQP